MKCASPEMSPKAYRAGFATRCVSPLVVGLKAVWSARAWAKSSNGFGMRRLGTSAIGDPIRTSRSIRGSPEYSEISGDL
jgi:hypothetical protein